MYSGTKSSFEFSDFTLGTEVRFRACAVRFTNDVTDNVPGSPSKLLKGVFSPVVLAKTMTSRKKKASESNTGGELDEPDVETKARKPLTDTQWALIFFLGFSLLAVVLALLISSLFAD